MKIVIPGGSGQIGTLLARTFVARGDEVTVLSRRRLDAPWRVVEWNPPQEGAWIRELDGADVVINLAGRSVNCRYTRENRDLILRSRVESTRAVGQAIAQSARAARVWLQASTATIYAHSHDRANDEASGLIGGSEPDAPREWGFSVDVARAWEQALDAAATPRTRRVKLRAAVVMSPDAGGIFDTLLRLVRRGLGGTAGDGRQYVSWVHEVDFTRSIDWLIARDDIDGAVNVTAPHPLPNAAFMRALREAWGTPIGLPAAPWMLAVGAWAMRTEPELVLKSRRVVPGRLLERGFTFTFPTWPEAARALCRDWRARARATTSGGAL